LTNTGVADYRALDDSTYEDESDSNGYADSSTKSINVGSNEWNGNHTVNLVLRGDKTSPDTNICDMEEILEPRDFQKRVEHRAIESIGSRAKESNEAREVQDESCTAEISRRLLDQG
jgi:hypothetical protein